MTQDLKDHVLIEKAYLTKIAYVYELPSDIFKQELNQDLSGMVVVPIKLTKEMFWAGEKAINQKEKPVVAWDVWEAMISAAQKEKNDA